MSSHGSSAVQPVIVTSIVGETTTVCPVTEASAVSSEVGASMSSAVKTTTGEIPPPAMNKSRQRTVLMPFQSAAPLLSSSLVLPASRLPLYPRRRC